MPRRLPLRGQLAPPNPMSNSCIIGIGDGAAPCRPASTVAQRAYALERASGALGAAITELSHRPIRPARQARAQLPALLNVPSSPPGHGKRHFQKTGHDLHADGTLDQTSETNGSIRGYQKRRGRLRARPGISESGCRPACCNGRVLWHSIVAFVYGRALRSEFFIIHAPCETEGDKHRPKLA